MFSKMPRARNLFFPFACNWVGQIPFTCKVPTSSNLRSRVWTHFHLLTIVGGMGWLIWCRTCWAPGSSPDIRRARGSNKPNRPTRQQSQPCTSSRNGSSRRRTAEEIYCFGLFFVDLCQMGIPMSEAGRWSWLGCFRTMEGKWHRAPKQLIPPHRLRCYFCTLVLSLSRCSWSLHSIIKKTLVTYDKCVAVMALHLYFIFVNNLKKNLYS